MVQSSLTPRRLLVVAGLVAVAGLAGCTTVSSSSTSAASRDAALPSNEQGAPAATANAGLESDNIYARRVQAIESIPGGALTHAQYVSYADALMHLGRPRKAIDVLISAEIAFPEAYMNAVYLGLAYEMIGDLKSARHWVARGIERNIEARGGTEWLHLAMIEARQALAKDPEWLRKHSVLRNNTHRTAEEILSAIKIQLAICGDLGLPPDAVVSDLYFEAGICANSLEARQDYFAQSLEISPLRLAEIQQQEKIRARAQASVQVN
ncbi:MAG: hypothetical protein IAE82_14275 [Opitutaceae bacterium]|nr:hypothetical protein [Opitutaceae bacterium]